MRGSLRPVLASLFTALPVMACAQAGGPQVIDSVAVVGNNEVPDAEIAGAVQLKPGATLAGPEQVKGDIDRIVGLYRRRGLDLAISPDIGHPAPGHLTLRYIIDEHGHGGDAGAAPPPGGSPPGGGAAPAGTPSAAPR